MPAFRQIDAPRSPFLIVGDHASAAFPNGETLGLGTADRERHIAVDLGAEAMIEGLARRLDCPALLAAQSRLLIDLNRPPDVPKAIPGRSDGTDISGNRNLTAKERAGRTALHDEYHERIAEIIALNRPALLLSLHSFTPNLRASGTDVRPWDAGLLYDRDDRASRFAIDWLRDERLTVGDNEPYSGREFGYTVQRHAEPQRLPYLFLEIRQDHLAAAAGVALWTERVAALMLATHKHLTERGAVPR